MLFFESPGNKYGLIMRGVEDLYVRIEKYDQVNDILIYHVSNIPICEYDQHSRARVGIEFFDYEVSEDPEYVLYTADYDLMTKDDEFRNKVFDTFKQLEFKRIESFNKNNYNLMSRNCSYSVKQTWQSLEGQMSRRLKFCEEQFIVGLHWLLRDKLIKMDINKANNLLPGCDKIKRCDYSSADFLSNMFGCLFRSCGRWPEETDYASFNSSCSNLEDMERELKITIPQSMYEIENNIR